MPRTPASHARTPSSYRRIALAFTGQHWKEIEGAFAANAAHEPSATSKLLVIGKYVLSNEGASALQESPLAEPDQTLVIERAAKRLSFQPRFLNVHLIKASGLPPMDLNGSIDPYVRCLLRSAPLTRWDPLSFSRRYNMVDAWVWF